MKRSLLVLLILTTCWSLPARAQVDPSETRPGAEQAVRGFATVSLMAGFPQREFEDHVDNVGFGGTLFLGAAFQGAPFVVGLNLDALVYGIERRSEPFSNPIPDVRVDVTTTNNIFGGHAVARLQPSAGAVRPYLGGLVGVKYFNTHTSIDEDRFGAGGREIASSTNFDDFAFSYGITGGFDVALGHAGGTGFALNLGVRYLFGGEAEYLKEGSIERHDGRVSYRVERSRTDLLLPQLGLTVTF